MNVFVLVGSCVRVYVCSFDPMVPLAVDMKFDEIIQCNLTAAMKCEAFSLGKLHRKTRKKKKKNKKKKN